MDSQKVNVNGIVNNVPMQLVAYPVKSFSMDISIVDFPTKWGMLLSRKWVASMGGKLQINLSYATISMYGKDVQLHREKKMMIIMENPDELKNEIFYLDVEPDCLVGYYDDESNKKYNSNFVPPHLHPENGL